MREQHNGHRRRPQGAKNCGEPVGVVCVVGAVDGCQDERGIRIDAVGQRHGLVGDGVPRCLANVHHDVAHEDDPVGEDPIWLESLKNLVHLAQHRAGLTAVRSGADAEVRVRLWDVEVAKKDV